LSFPAQIFWVAISIQVATTIKRTSLAKPLAQAYTNVLPSRCRPFPAVTATNGAPVAGVLPAAERRLITDP